MKHLKLSFLAFLAVISLNSCGENQKEKKINNSETEVSESTNGNLDDGATTANPEFENENIAAVYEQYLNLKSALVNTDPAEAQVEGKTLVDALQETEATQAMAAAKTIANTEDINTQRTAFSDLSAAVEDLLAANLTSGNIYKQYCPMAFEGEGGYWLSNSKEIRNPYYGDVMLECGSVRDTLK